MCLLAERFADVRERISRAAQRSHRQPAEVCLVAVSKKYPAESVMEANEEAGQEVFGESRVQESLVKIPALPGRIHWHFIGHLQSNKIRKALPLFELIHGVDTPEIAREIDRIGGEMGLFPRVLLEVNVSGEGSKHGFSPEQMERELEGLLSLPRLQVDGFMAMAPLVSDQEEARPYFRELRRLAGVIAAADIPGVEMKELSMGMSGDFEAAIEEGATLVRVGTALFGERNYSL